MLFRSLEETQTVKLAEAIEATLIHGITGQEVQIERLPAGTLISAWNTFDSDAGKSNLFLASEDGGETWRRYQSYDTIATTPINPAFVPLTDENGVEHHTVVSRGPKPPAAARRAIR